MRELGQGAGGSAFHDCRSRRSEKRSVRDDPRHQCIDRRENPDYPRRQADNLLPASRWCDQRPGRGGRAARTRISAASSSRRRRTRQQGVEITIVYASHANNVPLALLSEAQRTALSADGAGLDFGPPTGFVIKFTNGLTAYLSGDTGIHSEMKTVVNEYHKANLAVLNLGPNAGTVKSAALRDERAGPARIGDPYPPERGRHRRRQVETRFTHRGADQATEGPPRTSPSAGARWSSTARASALPDAEIKVELRSATRQFSRAVIAARQRSQL